MELAGQSGLLSTRRTSNTPIKVGGTELLLQSQSPLHEGHVALEGGWTFADLIRELNDMVFFWPGTKDSPGRYGARHIAHNLWDELPS